MPSYNRVMLMGNLTKDPEPKEFEGGGYLASFSIAVNRQYKKKSGEQVKEVSFFDVKCWARTAENVVKYLEKGSPCFIEGELKQERWETEGGAKRSKVVVNASRVQFLGTKKKEDEEHGEEEGEPAEPDPNIDEDPDPDDEKGKRQRSDTDIPF